MKQVHVHEIFNNLLYINQWDITQVFMRNGKFLQEVRPEEICDVSVNWEI